MHQSPPSGLRPPPSTPLVIEATPSYTSVWVSWGVLFIVGFLVTLVALFALQHSRRAKRSRAKEDELRKAERSRAKGGAGPTKVDVKSKLLGHPDRSRSGNRDAPKTGTRDGRRQQEQPHHHHRPSRSPEPTSKVHPAYRDDSPPSKIVDKHRREGGADEDAEKVSRHHPSRHREGRDGSREKERSKLKIGGGGGGHHYHHSHHRSDSNRS